MRCLEKDPALRPQSAVELAGELRRTQLASAWTVEDSAAWWRRNGALAETARSNAPPRSGPRSMTARVAGAG